MPLVMKNPPSIAATFLINNSTETYLGSYRDEVEENWSVEETSKPDPSWSFLDSAGHFHAASTVGVEQRRDALTFPTLRTHTVHLDCDGSGSGDCDGCDGYDVTRYRCYICHEDVEPKFRMTRERVLVHGLRWWEATVQGPFLQPSERVSVRILSVAGGTAPVIRFGVAMVTEITLESGANPTMKLVGSGALGVCSARLSTKEGTA